MISISKRILTLLLLVFITVSYGQSQGSATVPRQNPLKMDTVFDIRSRLVELAMAGPLLEIVGRGEIRAMNELSKTKSQVLNSIVLSGNLNEFTISGSTDNYANLFPRYNIGVALPIGTFITRDKDIRIAKQNVGIAQADKARVFAEVKAIVLKLYEDFLMFNSLFENQSKITDDEYLNFLKVEGDFENGDATDVEYTKAMKDYNEELEKKLNYLRGRQQAKIEIEKYIMVPLDDVIAGRK